MSAAFAGWTKQITLIRIVQSIVDGLVVDAEVPWTFEGTIQPLSPKQLEIKPDGLRSFEWLQIHQVTTSHDLTTNDKILYKGKRFKVMGTNDYSLNNYVEYHLVEDFQHVE